MLPLIVRMLNCLTISFQESSMGWVVALAPGDFPTPSGYSILLFGGTIHRGVTGMLMQLTRKTSVGTDVRLGSGFRACWGVG